MNDLREKIGNDLLLVPGVAAIIRDDQGRILIQQNKKGRWNLPAGAIDPGESPAKAVVREVFEETGLIVRPTRIVGILGGAPETRITYENGDVVESTTVIFDCEIVAGEFEPVDDETATLKYVRAGELPDLMTKAPPEIYDPKTSAYFEWQDAWLDEVK